MRATRQLQHPLHGVVNARPGDTSVDTSHTNVQDEADLTEPREVAAVFGSIGQDNQGAVGVPVADTDATPAPRHFEDMEDVADAEFRYTADPEAPQDAAGPEPRMGPLGPFSVEELARDAGAEAAMQAAAMVTRTDTVEMLDAMQSAEAAFGETPNPAPPPQPHHPVASFELRSKVQVKLAEALASNPGFAGDAAAAGAACEAAIFDAAHSAAVYQSVAANAVRVATQAADLNELLRVARGEPRGV